MAFCFAIKVKAKVLDLVYGNKNNGAQMTEIFLCLEQVLVLASARSYAMI